MDFGKIVVHGHTSRSEQEVVPNRINIDTGAFSTGRLGCAVLEGTTIASLPPDRDCNPPVTLGEFESAKMLRHVNVHALHYNGRIAYFG